MLGITIAVFRESSYLQDALRASGRARDVDDFTKREVAASKVGRPVLAVSAQLKSRQQVKTSAQT
jgi:hypothetical protein